jgi:hypothetical protein
MIFRDHTQTHHTWYDFFGRVISSMRRILPDNTQHSQQTDIHVPGWFRSSTRASDWPQTDALEREATGIGLLANSLCYLFLEYTNIVYIRNFIITVSYKMPTLFSTCCAPRTVGWGTALQAGGSQVRFPMGSLRFFIDLILALGSTQPLTAVECQGYFLGVKAVSA